MKTVCFAMLTAGALLGFYGGVMWAQGKAADAGQGQDVGRFQVVNGTRSQRQGPDERQLFRIDSRTGQVWECLTVPVPGTDGVATVWAEVRNFADVVKGR